MRTHAAIGEDILAGASSDLVRTACAIAGSHHERWDGNGYPKGLKGEAIPLEARITSVADVFDALCTERPYKPAWPIFTARREIESCAGTQFDPACVAAFSRRWDDIADLYAGEDARIIHSIPLISLGHRLCNLRLPCSPSRLPFCSSLPASAAELAKPKPAISFFEVTGNIAHTNAGARAADFDMAMLEALATRTPRHGDALV